MVGKRHNLLGQDYVTVGSARNAEGEVYLRPRAAAHIDLRNMNDRNTVGRGYFGVRSVDATGRV